ncbi:MAG: hypothetical protein M3R24_31090 [Chloroflexota bacterium]|nr:hypothetical protein [Chloroflexota bacterium]
MVNADAKQRAALLQERAILSQELDALPVAAGHARTTEVLSRFAYFQAVHTVAWNAAQRAIDEQAPMRRENIAMLKQIQSYETRKAPIMVAMAPEQRRALGAAAEAEQAEQIALMEKQQAHAKTLQSLQDVINAAQQAAGVAKAIAENEGAPLLDPSRGVMPHRRQGHGFEIPCSARYATNCTARRLRRFAKPDNAARPDRDDQGA